MSRGTGAISADDEVRVRPVASVMSTPVVTVARDESLATAWDRLYRGRLRHIVVVADGRVAGLLDDRSIALDWPSGPLGPHRRRVGDLVRGPAHCVLPETTVGAVAAIMANERLDAVPVVSRGGEVLGIVTAGDLVALLATCDPGQP